MEHIRRYFGMYIPEESVTGLHGYLEGFQAAMRLGELVQAEDPPFGHFDGFVARQLGYRASSIGWSDIIAEEYGDGERGIVKFFELLDEFREREVQVVLSVGVTDKMADAWRERHRKSFSYTNGGWEEFPAPAPAELRIVRFVPDLGVYLQARTEDGWDKGRYSRTLERCVEECQEHYGIDTSDWTAHGDHPWRWTRAYSLDEIESDDARRVAEGLYLLVFNEDDTEVVERAMVRALGKIDDAQAGPPLRAMKQTSRKHGGWSSADLVEPLERFRTSERKEVRRLAKAILRQLRDEPDADG